MPRAPETALEREGRVFRQQLGRLVNCSLNWVLDLTEKGSKRRLGMLLLLLPVLAFLFSLQTYPLGEWGGQLSRLFTYYIARDYAILPPDTPEQIGDFLMKALFGPETLRYLPVVLLPFILAIQAAANYLDDIFELGRVDIARDFILQVALTGNRKHIRIREGQIHPEDKDSPIYRIGGPGQVEVELDSVALFEKLDGRPHTIGPTVDGKATLEGFERFRQAIDLRDQYPNPLEVGGRSLDGIPVNTADVRMLFSIWRDSQEASIEHPHPFSQKAVEILVYGQVSRVNIRDQNPSDFEEAWAGAMLTLIRGELGGFMGGRRLVEYLASIGTLEVQQARERENDILTAGKAIVSEDDELQPRPVPPPPDFQARHRISNLFSQFATEFTEKASKRGVELHWVGVGTWKTPSEIVPEKHLEAWQLSRENLARSSEFALKGLKEEARNRHIISQIQDVPLARFQLHSDKDHNYREKDLLIAYREQLIKAVELLRKSKKDVPGSIYQAIEYIEETLGIKHWVH